MVKGFATTFTIVGMDGQTIVVLPSNGAPIHTIQNSFNKAYRVMTLGPLMHAETSALYNRFSHKRMKWVVDPLLARQTPGAMSLPHPAAENPIWRPRS